MNKILWAIPKVEKPCTGAEKFTKSVSDIFGSKIDISYDNSLVLKYSKNPFVLVWSNIRNTIVLSGYSNEYVIFQDPYYSANFILSNIVLSKIFRKKIVIFVNQEFFQFHKVSKIGSLVLRAFYSAYFIFAHKIIVNSRATSNWVNMLGDFKKKIYVLYPVMKKDVQQPFSRNYNDKNMFRILCVANIRKDKGQEYLVNAISMLKRNDIIIDFVGSIKEPDYYEYLKRLMEVNKLKENVIFSGFLGEEMLADRYVNSDLFVLPTLKEGFGMVLIDAMYYGLPIVASNVGGIPEIIENEAGGILVEVESSAKLAEAIEKLLKNSKLRETLGKTAQNNYLKLPEYEKGFIDIFEKISIK